MRLKSQLTRLFIKRSRHVDKHGGKVGFRSGLFGESKLYFFTQKPVKGPEIMTVRADLCGEGTIKDKLWWIRAMRNAGTLKYRKACENGWI